MKTVNKELIDFLTEIRDTDYKAMPMHFREKADKLVKSINSEAPDETPNVNNNEAQKKACETCISFIEGECKLTEPCINYDLYIQAD